MEYADIITRLYESMGEVKDELHANSEKLVQFMQRQDDHERYAERLEKDIEATRRKLAEVEGRVKTLEELRASATLLTRAVPYLISVAGAVLTALGFYFVAR